MTREQPAFRTAEGWNRILATARKGFEAHLASLTTVQQVFQFGERCLKDPSVKEPFCHFAFEDAFEAATPWSVQESSVHPEQECERSLAAAAERDRAVFRQSLKRPVECLDLDPEPTDSSFADLRPAEGVIDLCASDGASATGDSACRQ